MIRAVAPISAALVLLVTSLPPSVSNGEPRRRLSMRTAERAIDLGFQTELAGDYRGAREALTKLIETATTSDESAARERLREWIGTLDAREQSFRSFGKTARGYHDAFQTLRNFGVKRSSEVWRRALRDVPALALVESSSTAIRVRADLLRGPIDRASIVRQVSEFLERQGLHAAPKGASHAHYEVRLNVDATDTKALERGGARVTVSASMVVRAWTQGGLDPPITGHASEARSERSEGRPAGGLDPPITGQFRRLVGSVEKHGAEVRRNVQEARRFALKRVLDDASAALVFQVRAWLLGIVSSPPL